MADEGTAQSPNMWPMPVFHFLVEWDTKKMSFKEISGLELEADLIASKTPEGSPKTLPGIAKTGHVTLKKGTLSGDATIRDWFAQIKMNTVTPADMTISLLDENQSATMVWTLKTAFPVKVAGVDLNAAGNEMTIESLVIAHDGSAVRNA